MKLSFLFANAAKMLSVFTKKVNFISSACFLTSGGYTRGVAEKSNCEYKMIVSVTKWKLFLISIETVGTEV